MSCTVATIETIASFSERMGVVLTSVETNSPSGRSITNSSARRISPVRAERKIDTNSPDGTEPSIRRKASFLNSGSGSASRGIPKMRLASRLTATG